MRHRIANVKWQLAASGVVAAALGLGAVASNALTPAAPASRLAPAHHEARDQMIEKLRTKQAKPFDAPQEALDFYWAKRSPDGQAMSISDLEEAALQAAALPVHVPSAGDGDASGSAASGRHAGHHRGRHPRRRLGAPRARQHRRPLPRAARPSHARTT